MKSNGAKKYFTFVFATLAVGVLGVLMQTALLNLYYVFDDMLWRRDTPGIVGAVFYITAAVAALLAAAFSLSLNKSAAESDKEMPGPNLHDSGPAGVDIFVRAAAAACAAALLFAFASQFFASPSDHLVEILDPAYRHYYVQAAYAHIACLVLALPAFFYFLFTASDKPAPILARVIMILYVIAFILRIYYDMSMILTNPRRLSSIFSIISFLLFITVKEGAFLPGSRRALINFTGCLAFVCCLQDALPNLLLNITGVFSDGIQLFYYILMLTFAAYAFSCVRATASSVFLYSGASGGEGPDESVSDEKAPESSEALPEQDALKDARQTSEATNPSATSASSDFSVSSDASVSSGHDAASDKSVSDESEAAELTSEQLRRFYDMVCAEMESAAKKEGRAPDEKSIRTAAAKLIKTALESEDREKNIKNILSLLGEEDGKGGLD